MTGKMHSNEKTGTAKKLDKIKRHQDGKENSFDDVFGKLACQVAHVSGKPIVFLVAVLAVILWALSGPLFGFSDTWQLVINTSTTIITFLMVFLIQNTQNRDTMALQVKLAELIVVMQGADNKLATAEDMSDKDLERLHQQYRECAEETLEHLRRRQEPAKRAS
jgi:low affinity Fe/Cu permease